jgi:hypothetical protein
MTAPEILTEHFEELLKDKSGTMQLHDVCIKSMQVFAAQEVGAYKKEMAEKILKIRDAIVEKDYDEAWHWLYSIASPDYDKLEPWEELERLAERTKEHLK